MRIYLVDHMLESSNVVIVMEIPQAINQKAVQLLYVNENLFFVFI